MEQQINLDQPKQVTLTEIEETKIVNFITNAWDDGEKARAPYKKDWEECDKAYAMLADPIEDDEMKWVFNLILPWAHDSVDSWYATMHPSLMPTSETIFTITGRTTEDHPGAKVMEDYLKYCYERNRFSDQFGKALKQLARKNHTCVKRYWRKDSRVEYGWVTGEDEVERKEPSEQTTYNGVYFDTIDIEDFVFFPIKGDINKTTRIHKTYRYLDELKEAVQNEEAPYFNLDKIKDKGEPDNSTTGTVSDKEKKPEGVELKEAWIHRIKIGDKVYKNYVATIANGKVLIRFQPNPYPNGDSPFTWTAFNPDGNCLLGYGLNSPGLGIFKGANFIFNQRLNELTVKLYGAYTYNKADTAFNPYTFVSCPGALIGVGPETNLAPLAAHLQHLQIAYAEVAELKAEFESVTVPKAVKGMQEARQATATEISQVATSASGKQHVQAFHIEETLLGPLLKGAYAMTYQKMKEDPEVLADVARVTQDATEVIDKDVNGAEIDPQVVEIPIQNLVDKLPSPLPLPEVDVKLVGYQNVQRRQQELQSYREVIGELAQTPAAKYIKWDGVGETTFRLHQIDPDSVMMDEDERKEVDKREKDSVQQQQEHQQRLEELQIQKELMELQIKQQQNSLKDLEIRLRYAVPIGYADEPKVLGEPGDQPNDQQFQAS